MMYFSPITRRCRFAGHASHHVVARALSWMADAPVRYDAEETVYLFHTSEQDGEEWDDESAGKLAGLAAVTPIVYAMVAIASWLQYGEPALEAVLGPGAGGVAGAAVILTLGLCALGCVDLIGEMRCRQLAGAD